LKWIGQHIVDLIARFRSDVYLDSPTAGGSDPDKFLGIDSNNKIIYRTGSEVLSDIGGGDGDITSVTAGNALTGGGTSGALTINHEDTSSQASVDNSGRTFIQDIELDTYGHVISIASATDSDTHSGDITGVTIQTDSGSGSKATDTAGSADFSILGANGVGVTNSGTTITAVAVPGEIDHDSLSNFSDSKHFTQGEIVTVGTIGTGVWQGDAITTDYIGDDQVTEDKLADTLLDEIDANTAKATNVTTNLTATTHASQITINSSDGTNVVVAEASGSIAGVMTVAHHDKLDGIETNATADQTRADIEGLEITTVGTVSNGTWNGTKISSVYANTGGRRYGNILKILPQDFMVNHDVLTEPLTFKDGGNSGVAVSNTASEMIAFVAIPEGMKATALDIHATNNKTVKIFEIEIDDSFDFDSATANETGSANTQITIDPAISATALNYLAIIYVATATTNRIWGGALTIAPQ